MQQNPLAVMHKTVSEPSAANFETLQNLQSSRLNVKVDQTLFSTAGLNRELESELVYA